jgi:hypothetical protein
LGEQLVSHSSPFQGEVDREAGRRGSAESRDMSADPR